jgi:hypothetical protein
VTNDGSLRSRVEALSEHEAERLLQAVMDRLMDRTGDLVVSDEDTARELVAAFVSGPGDQVHSDAVVRPMVELNTYVRGTLLLLADDSSTAPDVESALADLQDETQMFADPVTAAVVLGALVAFLQTKVHASVVRKDGRIQFEFGVTKNATSNEAIVSVVEAVKAVTLAGS